MKKTNKAAGDSSQEFLQWLQSMPANVGPNDLTAINLPVELFNTAWMDLRKIAHRKGWTLEETVNELLTHCVEQFETDENQFMRQVCDDEEREPIEGVNNPRNN